MGIVVTSPPPPPATASQQDCKYSVRESYRTYVCYSQEEYDKKTENETLARKSSDEKAIQDIKNIFGWVASRWWQITLSILGMIILLSSFNYCLKKRDMKRNPDRYDKYGNKKYWY